MVMRCCIELSQNKLHDHPEMSKMWPRADGGELVDEPQVFPRTVLALRGSFSLRTSVLTRLGHLGGSLPTAVPPSPSPPAPPSPAGWERLWIVALSLARAAPWVGGTGAPHRPKS